MDDAERFEFDRQGYLVIRGLLSAEEVGRLSVAVDKLEEHALAHAPMQARKPVVWGLVTRHDPTRGYHGQGRRARGETLIVEDFWNADPTFDVLVDHAPTLRYVERAIQGRVTINNSEARYRYPGNCTGAHMGGPIGSKYRYGVNAQGIDCMMVRMVYFLHDVGPEDGPFSVVPGTHKSAFGPPARDLPDDEPGMIGLSVRSGDAVFFTENLRHGGLANRSERSRRTLHVGYGPAWMMSQNFSTMDQPQYLLPATLARYSQRQRALFQPVCEAELERARERLEQTAAS
ncbi:MAG: phytanoyl-CoA dioxygenase family protein [Planctomycetes bacterium]|nr:phytanoyl-CoA dioxygenase family protein [Planctomycetota bacterium]